MDLTNEQAQALFDAGCFVIISGLPEGSEVGIDGTFHTIRRFSGFKFVPPGLHLITWSLSTTSNSGPAGIPIRHAFIKVLKPKERVVLAHDATNESIEHDSTTLISEDHLKSLDKELAPYPFAGLESWKGLTCHIDETTLQTVLGGEHLLSGMTPAIGEEQERGEKSPDTSRDGESGLKFAQYRLKRSWRDGAIGEEVTRYSKDKSWLFGNVIKEQCEGHPLRLLGQLQLAFVLLINLSSYGALMAYKRLLPLFTESADLLAHSHQYLSTDTDIVSLVRDTITSLSSHLRAIPTGSFETELPEFDLFYLDEIESLRQNIIAAGLGDDLSTAWRELQNAGRTWSWDLGKLHGDAPEIEGDDSEEEGEFAPVVVEM